MQVAACFVTPKVSEEVCSSVSDFILHISMKLREGRCAFALCKTRFNSASFTLPCRCYYRHIEQKWSRGNKAQSQGHKKNLRPRTDLPGQTLSGHEQEYSRPSTEAQVFSTNKKSSKKFFRCYPKQKSLQNIFSGDLRKFYDLKK